MWICLKQTGRTPISPNQLATSSLISGLDTRGCNFFEIAPSFVHCTLLHHTFEKIDLAFIVHDVAASVENFCCPHPFILLY